MQVHQRTYLVRYQAERADYIRGVTSRSDGYQLAFSFVRLFWVKHRHPRVSLNSPTWSVLTRLARLGIGQRLKGETHSMLELVNADHEANNAERLDICFLREPLLDKRVMPGLGKPRCHPWSPGGPRPPWV